MSLNARRGIYFGLMVVFMVIMGWEVVYDFWRAVFGDHGGSFMDGVWNHVPYFSGKFGPNGTAERFVDITRLAPSPTGGAEHEPAGEAVARFWDLQVETYWNAPLFVLILDFVYGMHRGRDGGWNFAPKSAKVRGAVYAGLVVLALVCAAEGPLRNVLEIPLPNDIAFSVAHYFRRALEGVIAVIFLMVFVDVVKPGRLDPERAARDGAALQPA